MNFKNKTKIIENEEVLISIVKVQEILVYSIKNYWIDLSIESAEKLIYTYLINNKKILKKMFLYLILC